MIKRYLIRSPFDPMKMCFEDPSKWIWKAFAGGNSGNLMFAYGVMNVLKTQHTELSYTYKTRFTDEEIGEINEKYDAFILPLADAFRPQFIKQLEDYTSLIRRLRIPTIVIGIGLRAEYEPDLSGSFIFDKAARGFVGTVLEKSTIIGLRGGITADYLKKLGFQEETDFTVIGCPSLFTYGEGHRQKDLPCEIRKLALNTNDYYNIGHINSLICNTVQLIPDCSLIQQIQAEFIDYYIGRSFPFKLKMKDVPPSLLGVKYEELKQQDRVRYFFDVISWVNYLRKFDLFIGNRFHGSVAAILAGIPNVMMPFNARTREMTEYHHFTSLRPEDIRENTSIMDYLDQLDFHSLETVKATNLEHYMDFLQMNGLEENILVQKRTWEIGESPLEQLLQEVLGKEIASFCREVHGFYILNSYEKQKRLFHCYFNTGISAIESIVR